MKGKVAPRFEWALSTLSFEPSNRLLEIGCGHGIALSMVAERLTDGSILGIDRSPVMAAAARQRNAAAIRDGRVAVRTGTLDRVDLAPAAFDVAFAINVSLFTRESSQELARIRQHLVAGGRFYLFFEAPSWTRSTESARAAQMNLTAAGFDVYTAPRSDIGTCLIGQAF
jgi:cyclopropane fatty-acyl-phospholipid synthase-like methyltransferase